MTDIANNLKANFPAILILGGVGLGTGLLLKKKEAVKYGLIGAGIGAAFAALGVKLPGSTHVGWDLFAHGVPLSGDGARPGWGHPTPPPHPHHHFEHHHMGRHGFGREEGREHHHHHRRHPMMPDFDQDQDQDQDQDLEFQPQQQHHHRRQW